MRFLYGSFFVVALTIGQWFTPFANAQTFEQGATQAESESDDATLQRNQAIAAVVSNQIEAFQAGDAETAYGFAAPSIKTIFPNPQRFVSMVKRSYGMIFDPKIHKLEEVIERNGSLYQKALFVGGNNITYRAFYLMQEQPDGQWKINGVSLVRVEDQFT